MPYMPNTLLIGQITAPPLCLGDWHLIPAIHCSSGPVLVLQFQLVFTTQARLKLETFGRPSCICERGNASQKQRCKYGHIDSNR